MAKIYVSSTFLDLEEFREKILFHLQKMKQAVAAMEYYLADDRRPADKCIADVEICDIYIGIYAWRYGTIPEIDNPEKLSITEMEYQTARKKGIPCLIFLQDSKSPWPPDLVDDDKTRIKAFRKKVESEQSPQWFKNSDELVSFVGASLYDKLIALGYGSSDKGVTTFDLEKYYAALRKRYGVLALEGLTPPQKEEYLQITLGSVFVEQNVRENPPPVELPKEVWERLSHDKEIHPEDLPIGITLDDVRQARESYYEKPSRPVLDMLTDPRYQYTIILGDPGSGKSTLARYVMLSLIDPAGNEKLWRNFDGYLPLLIELRSYVGACAEDYCATFLEFLEYLGKTEGWALTQSALHNHLKNDGHAVVIFDGLDEIFDPEQREHITNQIVGFTNDYPKVRVIVTSRVIGYRRKILTDGGFTHFTLQDLDEKQVELFVTRWYDLAMNDRLDEAKERSKRILKSFKESASIRQLAGNPMLLTIMAIIGKHQELPRERWKLYDHAASVLIQHWDVNKHLEDKRIKAERIVEDDKKELLRRLAYRMQGGDAGLAGNYIHREQLQAEFESYLKERYSYSTAEAAEIARAMIEQFRERNFILSLYGANLYGFVHRAFLEYFCAFAFVWKFEKKKELTIEQLKTDVYGKHWQDQSWHEVLRLICGMVDEKWVGEIVSYLVEKTPVTKTKKGGDFLPWNIALAVQCIAETRNLITISGTTEKVLSAICSLFERIMLQDDSWNVDNFLSDQIVAYASNIGSNWPRRELLVNWLKKPKEFKEAIPSSARFAVNNKPVPPSYFVYETFGAFIGGVCSGMDDVKKILLSYLETDNEDYHLIGLSSLVFGWKNSDETFDLVSSSIINEKFFAPQVACVHWLGNYNSRPETPVILSNCFTNEKTRDLRSSAIYVLAEQFPNYARTLPLLQECVVQDKSEYVRRNAVRGLAEHYREDAGTLPLLEERAVQDNDSDVRRAAMSALAEHYREDAGTLPLLREWVVKSEHGDVRSAAVSAIIKYYREDAGTLPLLREWVVKSEHTDVRSAAVSALAEHYREDAGTLPLLRERAIKDESPRPDDDKRFWLNFVRDTAIKAIAKYWRDHPDTLPLLRERAENDPTPWLRERCKELIEEIEGKKE